MSEKISRRNFLRTATLGAAAAGLLAGCGSASSSTAASREQPDGSIVNYHLTRTKIYT